MRATLIIDDPLLLSVKKLAAEKGSSVSSLVEHALREFVNNQNRAPEGSEFRIPVFNSGADVTDSQPIEFHRLEENQDCAPFQQ
jgi:hypothetical protein